LGSDSGYRYQLGLEPADDTESNTRRASQYQAPARGAASLPSLLPKPRRDERHGTRKDPFLHAVAR
jgi:hypothetical protein